MDLVELLGEAKKKGFEVRTNDSRDVKVLKDFLNGEVQESSSEEVDEEASEEEEDAAEEPPEQSWRRSPPKKQRGRPRRQRKAKESDKGEIREEAEEAKAT